MRDRYSVSSGESCRLVDVLEGDDGRDGPEDFLLVGAGLRWHIGENRRPVEELVIAATGDESGASGDAVANYCVHLVSCCLIDQRSVGNIVIVGGVSDAKLLRPFSE